jgi:hypothetical protein
LIFIDNERADTLNANIFTFFNLMIITFQERQLDIYVDFIFQHFYAITPSYHATQARHQVSFTPYCLWP